MIILIIEPRLRAPQDVLDMVHAHYDKYRHENSGRIALDAMLCFAFP